MPSTFDPLLRLELQATGENPLTWGSRTNNNLELLAKAIAGHISINIGGSGTYTLTTANAAEDQARYMMITLTGTLTGNRTIIIPPNSKLYFFRRNTTGSFNVEVKTATGAAVNLLAGITGVYCNGVDCFRIIDPTAAIAGDITTSQFTMNSGRLLGRTATGSGAIQEITVGSGLTFSSGTLNNTFTNFLALSDTPSTYTGAADRPVFVNTAANALEFPTIAVARTRLDVPASADVVLRNGSQAMTGQLHLLAGASGGFMFAGDTDTGIFQSAADTMQLRTGGTDRLTIANTELTAAVPLALPGSPTAALHAATKQYVDNVAGRAIFQAFTASGTWTKPTGLPDDSRVLVMCWGAGGSGARSNTSAHYVGGGGGGGFSYRWFRLGDLPSSVTVTVGAGGAAKSGSNQNGDNGGSSSFGSLLLAGGGAGGTFGSSSSSVYGGGGGGSFGSTTNQNPGAPSLLSMGLGGQNYYDPYTSSYILSNPIGGIFHGGGAGVSSQNGTASIYGGGGGGGIQVGGSGGSGGQSMFAGSGGAAGATGTNGGIPGGGGGAGTSASGAGGRGEVHVYVFPVA